MILKERSMDCKAKLMFSLNLSLVKFPIHFCCGDNGKSQKSFSLSASLRREEKFSPVICSLSSEGEKLQG